MLILNINPCIDPAAVGQNLVCAINKYTEHTARHISYSSAAYITSWKDICYDKTNRDELIALIEKADILHFNQHDWMFDRICNKYTNSDILCNYIKPHHKIIYHGHGGGWLLAPDAQISRCVEAGARMVMCSPMDEATVGKKHGTWLPNIIPINDGVRYPDWSRNFNNILTVGLSANHSAGVYKGAEMVQYMVEHLASAYGYPLAYKLVTGKEINTSIMIRRQHHFTVDNWVQGFSGMAGFEGLALGHVVFARFDPLTKKKWAEFAPEMIPIVDIKGFDTCAAKIREYCADRDLLQEHSRASRSWIEKWYSEERILKMWIDFYESL